MAYDSVFLLNGVAITENIRGQPVSLFIEDAIQETTVLTSGISAEYGRFGGGLVNAITKSGGNQFSGSYRLGMNNDNWRALTPFNETKLDKVVPTHEYTIGGPVIRNTLWFFNAGRFQTQEQSFQTNVTNISYPRHQRRETIRREADLHRAAGTGGQRVLIPRFSRRSPTPAFRTSWTRAVCTIRSSRRICCR